MSSLFTIKLHQSSIISHFKRLMSKNLQKNLHFLHGHSSKSSIDHLSEQFSIERRKKSDIASVFLYLYTSLCDWSKRIASLSQPIRCKTKTNHDLVTLVSRGRLDSFSLWVLIGSLMYFPFFWVAFAITLVLVLRYSIEKRSITLVDQHHSTKINQNLTTILWTWLWIISSP